MATEIVDKKKNTQEVIVEGKSKGLNTFLWVLAVIFLQLRQLGIFISNKSILYRFVLLVWLLH